MLYVAIFSFKSRRYYSCYDEPFRYKHHRSPKLVFYLAFRFEKDPPIPPISLKTLTISPASKLYLFEGCNLVFIALLIRLYARMVSIHCWSQERALILSNCTGRFRFITGKGGGMPYTSSDGDKPDGYPKRSWRLKKHSRLGG